MIIVASILLTVGAASAEDCTWTADTVVDLIAGQNYDSGSVRITVEGTYLNVTFETEGDWLLYETHVNVSDFIPTVTAPGQYISIHENLGGVTSDTHLIPFSAFNIPTTCSADMDIYVAAHAVVKRPDNEGFQEETAWGEGTDFASPNWAMYIPVTLTCDCNGNGTGQEIPEFPTIALPIAAILGLAFFFQRRKE
jgi:hypothetical protein